MSARSNAEISYSTTDKSYARNRFKRQTGEPIAIVGMACRFPGDVPPARDKRLMPLSGKTDNALRELAQRYLAWLDNKSADLASANSADSPFLSDMAWTAGVGRSHFAHRAGVAFRDAESLRAALRAVVEDGGMATEAATKVAFVYIDGRLLPSHRRCVQYDGRGDILAVRLGTVLVDEAAAGQVGLPCSHERVVRGGRVGIG